MAKRRFQKGRFVIERGMAYSFYYEDIKQADGSLASRRVRHLIGRVGVDGLSERAARREHDLVMQAINDKRGSIAPAVRGRTFRDAVGAWRRAVAPNLSPATVRQHESYLRKHVLPKFGNEAPHTLAAGVLQQFATDLRATLSRKTVLNLLSAIFSILRYAERCNIPVAKVSFADLQLGTAAAEVERPFFTREQVGKIISMAKEPYKTLFMVAWLTGTRAGEILALKTSDLDFERHTIRVDESSDDKTRQLRQPKTQKSAALLPMPTALEMQLRNYLQSSAWKPNPEGLLFTNQQGTRPRKRESVVECGLKPILRKLGLPDSNVGLHAFRHGLATELAQRAIPLPDLQKQMRHSDVRTTLRVYAHAIPSTQRAAMESIADSLSIGTNVPIGTQKTANVFVN